MEYVYAVLMISYYHESLEMAIAIYMYIIMIILCTSTSYHNTYREVITIIIDQSQYIDKNDYSDC